MNKRKHHVLFLVIDFSIAFWVAYCENKKSFVELLRTINAKPVYLRELTPYQWDEVRIYRRPMDAQYETPDYDAIRQYDHEFNVNDDTISLMVFYLDNAVVGYESYPSYVEDIPILMYSDGITMIEYIKLACDEACFDIVHNDSGVRWILNQDGQLY